MGEREVKARFNKAAKQLDKQYAAVMRGIRASYDVESLKDLSNALAIISETAITRLVNWFGKNGPSHSNEE